MFLIKPLELTSNIQEIIGTKGFHLVVKREREKTKDIGQLYPSGGSRGESTSLDFSSCLHSLKVMASGSITSWQIDEETMETVTDFIFLGSKITADCDCSHEIKMLSPWKKSYD